MVRVYFATPLPPSKAFTWNPSVAVLTGTRIVFAEVIKGAP